MRETVNAKCRPSVRAPAASSFVREETREAREKKDSPKIRFSLLQYKNFTFFARKKQIKRPMNQ
jgi:hypothetical protein